MINVHLHGSLRKLASGPIRVAAATAAEAIELITSQLPGFQPTAQGYKHIRVADYPTVEELHRPLKGEDLHIYPQMNGGKDQGFVQILIGAALIAATVVTAGGFAGVAAAVSTTMAGTAGFGAMLTATVFMTGVSTVIGGLVSLIMPQPTMNPGNAQEASKYLGVPSSTTKIGTTIRVIYGLRRVGFHYLAFNTNARNYTPS